MRKQVPDTSLREKRAHEAEEYTEYQILKKIPECLYLHTEWH